MSQAAPLSPAAPRFHHRERAFLVVWHGGWALAIAAMISGWGVEVEPLTAWAGLLAATPGVLGLGLAFRDGTAARAIMMSAWIVAAVGAAGLAGGLAGPLAGLVFAPLAASYLLDGRRGLQIGSAGAALAALTGPLSVAATGAPLPSSVLLVAGSVVTLTALAAAVSLRTAAQSRRTRDAQATADRLSTILSAQPGLTLVTEVSGRVVAAYGRAVAGEPLAPLLAHGLADWVDPPDRPAVLGALTRASGGQQASVVATPRGALDRRLQLTLAPLDTGPGSRVIAQVQDATASHVRQIELETARAEAEAREAGKTRFLANMSHELRTPLNAVIGFADIMRQRIFGPLPDRYAEYADSIHQAGVHLLDLINDVLDMSKIEAERYVLSLERLDARDPVSSALALIRVAAETKGVALSADLPDAPIATLADARALKQIALNLLSNAVKFTPSGGSVALGLTAADGALALTVRDTGVGVSAEDLARIGRPFEQAGEASQRAQGSGLGLSLVRALAELHGGALAIDSTPGQGTTATVRLPVLIAGDAEAGAQIIPLPRRTGSA